MATHIRHILRRRWWMRLATIATLALLLVAAAAAPSVAMNQLQPGASTAAAQLATPTPAALPSSTDKGEQILNPFPMPVTETMTDTVRAILAVYTSMSEGAQSAQAGAMAVLNSGVLIYLPAIKVAPAPPPFPTSTPTPTPNPAKSADLAVTIWPSPSIIVIRGQTLIYELRVKNYGKGEATRARVTLPYTEQQLTVIDSRLTDPRDWVSKVADDHVDVTFGPVAAGKYRTAAIIFRVKETLADRTVISMRANYSWSDHRDGGAWRSNWAPVVIGAGNESAPWVPLLVDPLDGISGTTHHFSTDRFIPSEGIYTWLNTPYGVEPLELRGTADLLGRVWLDFSSTRLRPGTYQLVTYGARSNLTGVATFYVW
jgi:hypothetical protein